MIKKTFISCILLLLMQVSYSQVGVGTTSPDASSALDLSSTNKGVLLPRMTTAQRNAITNPAKGLTIYNLTEDCLQINSGTTSSPNWSCIGSSSSSIASNCDANGFQGVYANGVAFTAANKFSVTITNNGSTPSTISFASGDLALSGVSGVSVGSPTPASATIAAGATQVVEYALTGTPASTGALTAVWTKSGVKSCSKPHNIGSGDATFTLPKAVFVVSTNDGTPVIDLQGVVDNNSNKLTVTIPYTGGVGTYTDYQGTFTANNAGTAEGSNESNRFRLSYSGGTFSASGTITATIEVDGDGSFNAKKQNFGTQQTIAALDFQVNGNSKGNVNLNALGGIPDRNFADANHKFIYLPVTARDNRIWLNNNLGANYSNMNHPQYNPTQKARSHDDHHAYGSLYQWGRFSDGHELINYTNSTTGVAVNGPTNNNSTSNTPTNSLFITEAVTPFDWRVPQQNGLWQGESGPNNPCPQGFRVPTEAEMTALVSAENITNRVTAAGSSLAFSTSGVRIGINGQMASQGNEGYHWTSTIGGTNVRTRLFNNNSTVATSSFRGFGLVARCIRNN